MQSLFRKIIKFIHLIQNRQYQNALWCGVAAAIEHEQLLSMMNCKTVIDIGANRGQFALVARSCFSDANIVSFEPLPGPSSVFRRVFSDDSGVNLHQMAIGPEQVECKMHISARDDSSSLLPISSLQDEIFPGTNEVSTIDVQVVPLDEVLSETDITDPAMLKLDVQGFEMDALRGCEALMHKFDWIYCECSFVELYYGQKLAADVISWLSNKGFLIKGIYNPAYDSEGRAIQADFLFARQV